MPFFHDTKLEFEALPNLHTPPNRKPFGIAYGVGFSEGTEVKTFKAAVLNPSSRTQMALKYSAFYPARLDDPTTPHTVMLGWDHAIQIERKEEGWFVDSIWTHGEAVGVEESRVYQVTGEKTATQITGGASKEIAAGKHSCGHHKQNACKWLKYDLSSRNIQIGKLVTFSITSCSFACLWPDDKSYLVVSHMAFSPAVPVVWIAKQRTGGAGGNRSGALPRRSETTVSKTVHLNLLASINASDMEQSKYTQAKLAHADEYDIDAKLISRGPLKRSGDGDNAPYKTHPYTALTFAAESDAVQFYGALGYNNDPTLPFEELPPFHSLGHVCDAFDKIRFDPPNYNALSQEVLDAVSQIYNGDYGFQDLHQAVIETLYGVDMREGKKYATPKFTKLMKATYTTPGNLTGRERAVFRLGEMGSNPRDKAFAGTYKVVMDVWKSMQFGFRFPLELLFNPPYVEREEDVVVEEIAVTPSTPSSGGQGGQSSPSVSEKQEVVEKVD